MDWHSHCVQIEGSSSNAAADTKPQILEGGWNGTVLSVPGGVCSSMSSRSGNRARLSLCSVIRTLDQASLGSKDAVNVFGLCSCRIYVKRRRMLRSAGRWWSPCGLAPRSTVAGCARVAGCWRWRFSGGGGGGRENGRCSVEMLGVGGSWVGGGGPRLPSSTVAVLGTGFPRCRLAYLTRRCLRGAWVSRCRGDERWAGLAGGLGGGRHRRALGGAPPAGSYAACLRL